MIVSHRDTDRLRRQLERMERSETETDGARGASGVSPAVNLTVNYSGTLIDRRSLKTFAEDELVPILNRVIGGNTYRRT